MFQLRLACLPCMVVVMFVMLLSCSRHKEESQGPRERLKDYITKSFSVSSVKDRQTLEGYLTGPALNRLKAWSDQQFEEAFIEKKRTQDKLVFKEVKKVSANEMNITYEVSYLDKGASHQAKVTNRKMCILVQENGQWLIRDVQNIRELVEYQNEMALP